MHTAIRNAAAATLRKHHPDVTLPETREELDAILEKIRPPNSAGRLWAGVRPALAQYLRIKKSRPEYHTWFSAAMHM